MAVAIEKPRNFLNSREWRTFLSAAQSAAAHPSVMTAVRATRAWLNAGAAKSCDWPFAGGRTRNF